MLAYLAYLRLFGGERRAVRSEVELVLPLQIPRFRHSSPHPIISADGQRDPPTKPNLTIELPPTLLSNKLCLTLVCCDGLLGGFQIGTYGYGHGDRDETA